MLPVALGCKTKITIPSKKKVTNLTRCKKSQLRETSKVYQKEIIEGTQNYTFLCLVLLSLISERLGRGKIEQVNDLHGVF